MDIPTLNYFDAHFAFFFGQLDVDSMIQMLGRIRDTNVPKYVWAKKFILAEDTKLRPSNLESISADRARLLMAELHSIIENTPNLNKEQISSKIQTIYQNNLDPYTTAADTITAIRNHEFSNYRECLKRQLIDSGYPVESVTSLRHREAKAIAREEKEAKTEVKQQNSKDIYQASDKYIGQKSAFFSFDADWSTRCAQEKAKLVNRLPGINRDRVWSPEFIKLIKYDLPNLIEQTKLYYLLENPEIAKQLSLEKYNGIFNRGAIAAPWKLRQDYLRVKALIDIGLMDLIHSAVDDPDFVYTAESEEVKAIITKCRYRKHRDILGTPGKDPIKFVNKLMRSVGIQTKTKRRKKNGRSYSVYLIDRDFHSCNERLAIIQAIQLKYEEKINLNNRPLEWVNPAQNLHHYQPLTISNKKRPKILNIHSLEAVTDRISIYINNSTIYHPQTNQTSMANYHTEICNTNQLQESLDSEESIADLAEYLMACENAEDLAELQQSCSVFTSDRLNRACRLLTPEWQQIIRKWAIKNQGSNTAIAEYKFMKEKLDIANSE